MSVLCTVIVKNTRQRKYFYVQSVEWSFSSESSYQRMNLTKTTQSSFKWSSLSPTLHRTRSRISHRICINLNSALLHILNLLSFTNIFHTLGKCDIFCFFLSHSSRLDMKQYIENENNGTQKYLVSGISYALKFNLFLSINFYPLPSPSPWNTMNDV